MIWWDIVILAVLLFDLLFIGYLMYGMKRINQVELSTYTPEELLKELEHGINA